MITHFPYFYPDELLYSACARFSLRVSYPSAKSTLKELYGTQYALPVLGLPQHLSYFVAHLPQGADYTVDRLIDQRTLFPYFSNFLPPERATEFRDDMRNGGGAAIHMRSGIMASRIPTPRYLRFCPCCASEDKEHYGESYWHRLHQVPGVEVCLIHQVFIENSEAFRNPIRNSLRFIAAEEIIGISLTRRLDSSNHSHMILLKIARDSAWLLEHAGVGLTSNALYNCYLRLLLDRGLATFTGSIRARKLIGDFKRFYPHDLLKFLYCAFAGKDQMKTNWLLRLVRKPKHVQHSLYHLLLIQFLNCTAEEFFQLPEELSFFGEGPWPCLNPTAEHYREPVIRERKLSSRLRDNRPVSTFSCECGFAYSRSGPDSSPDDRFRVGRMISFGQVWETKLKQLWQDFSLSLSEVGRRLGVDPLTVRRHAARLRLSCTRFGRKSKPLNLKAQLKGQQIPAVWKKKKHSCRSKWLTAIRQDQKITLKALRHKLPREYARLLQNDSAWLKKHKPRPQKRNRSTSGVDWQRRDAQYAVAVRDAAARLKNAAGRPIQITRTAIGRAIGAITLLQQKLHKMPLTAQVLASVVETREQYAVRRVWWAAGFYCQETVLPQEWQLVQRANVNSLRTAPAVKIAIDEALRIIESKLLLEEDMQAVS